MVPVFVKDGIEFKSRKQKGAQEREPEAKSPARNEEPEVHLPGDDHLLLPREEHEVEDPLNLLSDGELEAEGIAKKQPLLT